MIRLDNLTKSFRGKPALHGLSLEVPKGEIFGLLGHNGAGKSTALGILLGHVHPDSGEAFVGGISVQRERAAALDRTGAIFEAPRFYDYMSGWENLRIFSAYTARVSEHDMKDAVETVALTARIHDRVQTYSQGMRQRLGLAQALLPAPQLILLDEPTNGLDPEGIHEMRELIKKLNREREITVLFCSHLLSEVEQLCDRVAVIKAGRKIFDGRWSELAADRQRVRFEVDDWARAAGLLEAMAGVRLGERGEVLIEESVAVPDLVAALVHAGIRVGAVEPARRNLEQIYLEMSHADTAANGHAPSHS